MKRAALWMAAAVAVLLSVPAATALSAPPTGTYRLALIRVLYSDTVGSDRFFLKKELDAAAGEIHDFFAEHSYGKLDLRVRVVQVELSGTYDSYWTDCARKNTCEAPGLTVAAVKAAAAAGLDFGAYSGVAVLTPACAPPYDVTSMYAISVPGVSGGPFNHAYLFECSRAAWLTPPGPSKVWWESWAHEIGHELQNYQAITTGGKWNGHPSQYASGYDLMDSCYPCHSGAYSIAGPAVMGGSKQVFTGWLDDARIVTMDAPAGGAPVASKFVLASLAQGPTTVGGLKQVLKIILGKGAYYFVQARTSVNSDAHGSGAGKLFDEGVQIQRVDESADPPVKNINSCDYTVTYGCVYYGDPAASYYDKRAKNCNGAWDLSLTMNYCWPFPLFHVGDRMSDKDARLAVSVDGMVGSGAKRAYVVTVTRGTLTPGPSLYITPWYTPPMFTAETTDIWVDSSCNGYEDTVGAAGLRYGRRGDGTVVGSGDDPCVNHDNRLYATVHSGGPVAARDVRVTFEVSTNLHGDLGGYAYCDSGDWTVVGTATSADNPDLALVLPGKTASAYVTWKPKIALTPDQIEAGHFAKNACIRVTVDSADGELTDDYHAALENIYTFEAREIPIKKTFEFPDLGLLVPSASSDAALPSDATSGAATRHHPRLSAPPLYTTARLNPNPRTFYLEMVSKLPRSWTLRLGRSDRPLVVAAGQMLRVPLHIGVPPGAPIGELHELRVAADTGVTLYNPAIPPRSGMRRTHRGFERLGSASITVHTVIKTDLTLNAASDAGGRIAFSGALDPAHDKAVITVDFLDASGGLTTRLARTNAKGLYAGVLRLAGVMTVRSLWQGDMDHSSAISKPTRVRPVASPIPTLQPQPSTRPNPTPAPTHRPNQTAPPQTPPPQQTPPAQPTPLPPAFATVSASPDPVYFSQCQPQTTTVRAAFVDPSAVASAILRYRFRRADNAVVGSWNTIAMSGGPAFSALVDAGSEAPPVLGFAIGFMDYQVVVLNAANVSTTSSLQTIGVRPTCIR